MSSITIETATGDNLACFRDDLAALRIAVFRQWPYLYEGDAAYEARYIERYVATADAVLIIAREADTVVGAATAMPLAHEMDAFRKPFADAGYDPAEVFYFGESVLLPAYRGQGIGHRFFDAREQHAAGCGGYRWTAFCAVRRDKDDPRQPDGYRPLDGFWQKRGYCPVDGLTAQLGWCEIGQKAETDHLMQFWLRAM